MIRALLLPLMATLPLSTSYAARLRPLPASLHPAPQQRDPYDWQQRHEAVKAYNQVHKPEYALIGDSITHHWAGEPSLGGKNRAPEAWASLFGTHRVVNMGFGFDYIDNAYYRILDGELAGHSPRVILILLGTNNLEHRKDTPEACAANMAALLDLLQAKAPESKILLISILPRREKELAQPIAAANAQYRQLAAESGGKIAFLDLSDAFAQPRQDRDTPPLGNPAYLGDAVHPNKAGYEAIAPLIRDALKRMDPSF